MHSNVALSGPQGCQPPTPSPSPAPGPYLHAGNADAHSPNDPQVVLDERFQLGDAAALAGGVQ